MPLPHLLKEAPPDEGYILLTGVDLKEISFGSTGARRPALSAFLPWCAHHEA